MADKRNGSIRQNLAIRSVIFENFEIGGEYPEKNGNYVLKLLILDDTQNN